MINEIGRYITGFEFILLYAVIIGLWVVYSYVIRRSLMKMVKRRGGIGFDFSFLILERLVTIIVLFVLVAIFILYKPVLGGVITVVLYGIGYKSMVDIIRGVQLISEMGLEVGKTIFVGDTIGIIHKLAWTGIFLSTADKVEFITYTQLAKQRVGYHMADIPVVNYLFVKSSVENLSLKKQEELLKNQLFAHPMLSGQHKPLILHKDGGLQIQLGVTNRSQLESFVNQLEKVNFDVTIID